MDFSPMNIRMTVPQANDVGQIQHNLNQQGAMQQDFLALKEKQLIERQQSQVRTKDDAEGQKVRGDEEKKQQLPDRKPRRRKTPKEIMDEQDALEAEEEPKMAVDQFRGHTIDISL